MQRFDRFDGNIEHPTREHAEEKDPGDAAVNYYTNRSGQRDSRDV